MKKTVTTFYLLLLVWVGFAQNQTNTWYFGNQVGLDFNQTPPRPLIDGVLNSYEGCATISDNNGNLLFYTNGQRVVNRKHIIMPGGNGLYGHTSSTNNTFIIPLPGNDSLYYIFTTSAAGQEFQPFGYSIVNIKADGGFGAVIQLNNTLEDGTAFEKIAATRHCNKRDVWIVVREWDSDEYHSYLLTPAGINPVPVVSNTGLTITGHQNNSIGTLKFSRDGSKLVAAHSHLTDKMELMDFDNVTGVLSNPIIFQPNAAPPASGFLGVYGAEFSPNGDLLYISANNSLTDPSTLYQFDISSNNAATIMSTKQVIAQTSPWFAGALQRGPDGKIYMAMWEDSAISVIENPDVYGPGCNFSFNKIRFIGKSKPVQFGLPSFIATDFDPELGPYDFTRTAGSCADPNVTFIINRVTGIDSVRWFFGDGGQSQALSPTHTYAAPGYYDVELIVYKSPDCSGLTNDTITHTIWIADAFPLLGTDISECDISDITLSVGITDVNYLWSTGSTSNSIVVNAPGLYWVEVEKNGCRTADSINIIQLPTPVVELGPDTSGCANQNIILTAVSPLANSYLWNTGETTPSITIQTTGQYFVTVRANGCEASDTMNVFAGDCNVFIPGAFTPNGDGLNDNFGVLNDFLANEFSLQVFNRYGQVVFIAKNISDKWDGTYKGKKVNNGAYPWVLSYINSKGYTRRSKGIVLVLH